MTADLEDKIRQRAHAIWEQNGRIDGQAEQHWLQAQADILASSMAETLNDMARTPAAKAPPKRAPAKGRGKAAKAA